MICSTNGFLQISSPPTYFLAHPRLLSQIPADEYPLVVKPNNGSSCRGIYRLNSPADLDALEIAETDKSFFLAQRYAENGGFDIKIYVTGTEVHTALTKKSPLHPEIQEADIPLSPQLRKMALQVGKLFGLTIYGIDVVETPHGFAMLDINDFPSFGRVPRAATHIAEYILHAARQANKTRVASIGRKAQQYMSMSKHTMPLVASKCRYDDIKDEKNESRRREEKHLYSRTTRMDYAPL
jgi:ribosomal protein S6--L-glutamate ligase